MTIHNEDGKTQQSTAYSWSTGTINKAGTAAGTDLTTIAGFTGMFTPFTVGTSPAVTRLPWRIRIESTGSLYISINGGDVITVTATTPFEADDLVINTVYASDASGSVDATVYLQ